MTRKLAALLCALALASCSKPLVEVYQSGKPQAGRQIHFATAASANPDPYEAGRLAAEGLKRRLVKLPHAVVVSECFDGEANKRKVLQGICSVFPPQVVFGAATYGSFTNFGATDRDSVTLLGIAGDGVAVAAALERDMGTATLGAEKDQAEIQKRLRAAGARLAAKLPNKPARGLLIVVADAHSPKNAHLVEGLQEVLGTNFPITGGSANKNAGQTYVYFQGRMFRDSALALLVTGDFEVQMVGRQAKEGALVVSSAEEAAREAMKAARGKPIAALAFDCAGRKGKVKSPDDELRAIRRVVQDAIPLFGCYCAGEIGPADEPGRRPNAPSKGVGWHIMFTVISR